MTQPNEVAAASVEKQPSDNELIMGVVTSGNPLTVTVRGDNVQPGRLSTAEVMVGGTVALLREEATWLLLGQVIGGNGVGGLGLTQLLSADATGALPLTAVDQAIPGLSIGIITTNPNAIVFTLWTTEFITVAANTSTSNSQLYIDGIAMSNQSATFRADATAQRATIMTGSLNFVTVPGAHTIVVQARTSGGAGLVTANNSNSNMIVAVIE